MNFKVQLEKLKALPDRQKKIIMWAVVGVLAVVMLIFWFKSAMNRLSNIGQGMQIDFPKMETEDIGLPAPQMPNLENIENENLTK